MLPESNGEIAPAMTALITRLTKACTDATAPRCFGKRSSSSKVKVGKLMPMPIALRPIGNTDHGTPGCGNITATSRFSTAAPSMIA